MSKFRCPVCGASHKDPVDHCRLCGQSMATDVATTHVQPVAQSLHAPKGVKAMVAIGVFLVIGVLAAAVVLGLIKPTKEIEQAKGLVTGKADGWTTQVDDDGRYLVDLPGTRTRQSTPFPVTEGGEIKAWTSTLGSDTEITVGWGKVSPPLVDGVLSTAAATNFLKDQVVPQWLAAGQLDRSSVTVTETGAGGVPGVSVRTIQPRAALAGQDAYAFVTFGLNTKTLYVLRVVTIYKDTDQPSRLLSSFVVTGAVA